MGKLLRDQQYVSQQRRMPVDNIAADAIKTVPSATIQLFYYNAGTLTTDAGQAAGVVCVGKLANRNIKNALGDVAGTNLDTSVAFTSTAFTSLVKFPFDRAEANDTGTGTAKAVAITSGFSNGDYCIDHRTGTIYGVKASTQTSLTSCTYKVDMAVSGGGGGLASDANIIEIGGVTISAKDAAFAEPPLGVGYEYEALGALSTDGSAAGDKVPFKGTDDGILYTQLTDGTSTPGILARTSGTEQPAVTDDALVVYNVGASSVPDSEYKATSNGLDGTVVYASASTLELSGPPHTVNSEDLVYVREVDATGNTAEIFVNGAGGVHLEISSGTVTKSGGTDFSANGVYVLGYNGQDKGYNEADFAYQTSRLNPESQNFTPDSLVDTTNLSAATYDYEFVMDGYQDLSLSGKFIDADGTVTMKVWMMNDEDTASGDWIQVYGYNDDLNTTTNSWTITNGTLTYGISFNNTNYTNVKVEIVCSGATNTIVCKSRRKAL